MKRSLLLVLFALGVGILPAPSQTDAPKRTTAADKVKATATRPDADGKQTVTITLEIEKGIILGANPVNHNNEFLDSTKLTVRFAAKEKVSVDVKYPAGKTRHEGGERYDIYEGTVRISADVLRTKGDTSPLEVSIRFRGWGLGY